jgi:hypothetical protein
VSALRFGYVLAVRGETEWLQYFATIALSLQLTIIGLCFAGPVFNTQLGIQFWTLTGALFGAAQTWQEEDAELLMQHEDAHDKHEDVIDVVEVRGPEVA